MERVYTLVVLVILIPCFTIHGQEQQEALCPSGWFKERSSCYKLSKNDLNWQAANKACEDLNSTLAIISSEAEHKALKTYIRRKGKRTWIGLHRNPRDKKRWLWVDGSPLNYTHWGDREPNRITEECVEIRPSGSHNGGWNDQECSDIIHYICEKVVIKESQVSPYPSTSLTAKSPQMRTVTPPNINHLPATSSQFHPKVMVSSSASAHQSFLSSSSVQIKVITPRQVSPYSLTPLTAAQSRQVRTLLPPSLHNYKVTVSSSAHQSASPSSSVQMKGQARNISHVNVARVSSVELVL